MKKKKKSARRVTASASEVRTLHMRVSETNETLSALINRMECVREQLRSLEGPTTDEFLANIRLLTEENQRLLKHQREIRNVLVPMGALK